MKTQNNAAASQAKKNVTFNVLTREQQMQIRGGIDNAPEEKERGITINTSIDNAPEEKER